MKPTADQVIQEFDELSPEDKQRVYITIKERGGDEPIFLTNNVEASIREIEKLLGVKTVTVKSSNKGIQKVLWKDILIGFVPNKYIQTPKEIWQLESVLGADIVRNNLRKYPILDADFVENLFKPSPYYFYINQSENYLFSDLNELYESDFGPLSRLTALEAIQRYGLTAMEESKEKGYTNL